MKIKKFKNKYIVFCVATILILAICVGTITVYGNQKPSPPPNDNRIVITADTASAADSSLNTNESLWGAYISPLLQEKMQEYEGAEVYYRIFVEFPYLMSKYYEDYEIPDETTAKVQELEAKAKQLEEKYDEVILKLHNTSETSEEKEALEKEAGTLKEAVRQAYEDAETLRTEEGKLYFENTVKNELGVFRQLGVMNIVKLGDGGTSDYEIADYVFNGHSYFMEATAEMIDKMYDRGYCLIFLATEARKEGYNEKISDSLTVQLEKIDNDEKIKVAVVSTADRYNLYADSLGIANNKEYRAAATKPIKKEFPKTQEDVTAYDADIKQHIEAIIWRHSLSSAAELSYEDTIGLLEAEKKCPSYDYFNYVKAGFTAELTKAQILSLVSDEDVKVIYYYQISEDNSIPYGMLANE